MIITPRCVFLHIRKTGGHWVKDAVCASGALHRFYEPKHLPLDQARSRGLVGDRLVCTFVRHPVDWYRSWWRYRGGPGVWSPDMAVDIHCEAPTLSEFALRCAETHPGWVSNMYWLYTEGADLVGKQESLAADLKTMLDIAGEAYDPGRLHAPAANISRGPQETFTDAAYQALMESESRGILRYGYRLSPPRDRVP